MKNAPVIGALFILLSIALSSLAGCNKQATVKQPTLTGTLTYKQPVQLERGTVIELRLTDVSVSDGPALEVAKVTLTDARALPHQYSLPYDPATINAQHRYTIDARVITHGQLRYSTDAAYEVLNSEHGNQRDLELVAAGSNESSPLSPSVASTGVSLLNDEVQTALGHSLVRAGLQDGHLLWLEEDRSNNTPQPLHARYEFNGAYITRYTDSSPLLITFDERGRPSSVMKQGQAAVLAEQLPTINAVRNQAALLRSHALAVSEARAHRQATGG